MTAPDVEDVGRLADELHRAWHTTVSIKECGAPTRCQVWHEARGAATSVLASDWLREHDAKITRDAKVAVLQEADDWIVGRRSVSVVEIRMWLSRKREHVEAQP